MIRDFKPVRIAPVFEKNQNDQWSHWTWQMRNTLRSQKDFEGLFALSEQEKKGFDVSSGAFKIAATPYYASLACDVEPVRRILLPTGAETVENPAQEMEDPLAEVEHSPTSRIIHRYSDRVIFLVTDMCGVYCRFCTRKRFTGQEQGLVNSDLYKESLNYIKNHPGIREVIFSGGDPLTLSNNILSRLLSDVRAIEHVEVIRIGSRMPVVCPMRIDKGLCKILRAHAPVFLMSHFSHPKEITLEASRALTLLIDNGVPVLNQMVLLNGVNNSAAIIQGLNRRLLFLRVKPYYMFQCDPSEGTDHLRTSVEESEGILRELWGHFSGIGMPSLALDIPAGGGKTILTPNFMVAQTGGVREFRGWDGRLGHYKNPKTEVVLPQDVGDYLEEWNLLKSAKSVTTEI